MDGLRPTTLLTAHVSDREDGASRRGRGRTNNVLQAGVAASTAIVDANVRAALLESDRDRILIESHHARDALRELQEATARAAAAGTPAGMFAFISPPPDPFTSELLKRDALVEHWSLAFHEMSIARDRESADAREFADAMRRATRRARDAEDRAASLADELISAQRDLAAARNSAEQVAKDLRHARRDLAARDAHAQHEHRRQRPAITVPPAARAQAEASLARHRLRNLEAGQDHTSPSAADLLSRLGALGPLKPPIPTAPVLSHSPRHRTNDTYLSNEDRARLLQQAATGDSDSSDGEPGAGRGSSTGSHISSAKRRDSRATHSSDGSSPASSRRRRASPAADFETPGSARGP